MKYPGVIALLLIIAPLVTYAQFGAYDHVQVSLKHSDKLEKITSPAKKLKKYHKYYSKDSVKLVRNLNRYWKQKSDSLSNSVLARKQQLESKKSDALNKVSSLASATKASIVVTEDLYRMPPELEMHFSPARLKDIYAVLRQLTIESSNDSAGFSFVRISRLTPPIPKIQSPVNPISLKQRLFSFFKRPDPSGNPAVKHALAMQSETMAYQSQIRKYQSYGETDPESLKGNASDKFEKEASQRLSSLADFKDYQKNMGQMNQLQATRDQYKSQIGELTDSTKRREMLANQASQAAMKYIEDNPAALKSAQRKMSLLMKRYSSIANSNDLSSAVKKTSLRGKSVGEHLLVAANFQVLGLKPVSFDFSPQVGYKFSTKLAIGIGGTYRQTLIDSLPRLSPTVFGYKASASFDVYKSFFLYGEYDRNSPGTVRSENTTTRIWKPAAFIGVGRTFSVHKKIDMTVVALYNFLFENGDPIYPRPFILRFGFQLSELAMLKRKPTLRP